MHLLCFFGQFYILHIIYSSVESASFALPFSIPKFWSVPFDDSIFLIASNSCFIMQYLPGMDLG